MHNLLHLSSTFPTRFVSQEGAVTLDDEPFLAALYATTRSDDLAGSGWTVEQRDALLAMQFRAQQSSFRQHFADADQTLILAEDEPIGALSLARRPDEIRVVEIALLPAWRNRGLGTHILQEIQAEARAKQLPIVLHVVLSNPARRLYARLGFQIEATEGLHSRMVWRS